jgi:thymidylate synthase
MNNIEHDYLKLLHDVLHNGIEKDTRNGKTRSVFGRQIRHTMSKGFPLLTTKKMPFRLIATEMMWFLRGDTNIKFLVDNGCNIWNGDAYKNYWEYNKMQSNPKWLKPVTYSNGNVGAELYNMEEFINKIKTDDEFAKKWSELGPIYGKQWRHWTVSINDELDPNRKIPGGYRYSNGEYTETYIDQIANLINDLKTNPDSRRLMVTAWNPAELDKMTLPPCHYGFQIYTRELSLEERRSLVSQEMFNQIYNGGGPDTLSHSEINQWNVPTRAISLMWNQRSVDTFLGLPFNIASYALLLHIIAEAVNMIPDELIGNLGDVHLYENHLDQAKEQLTREPMPLPNLNINTEFWPTESGECGEGPIDAVSVFNAFNDDNFCRCLLEEDLQLYDYQSHPHIKAPLSN